MSLQLVRFWPDGVAFQRWGHRQGLIKPNTDDGYAWHALLKTVLGDQAPQPFSVRSPHGELELLGYSTADTRLWQPMAQDPDALQALRLQSLQVRAFPSDLACGDRLSFEVRVRPIVRAREGRDHRREMDAAVHARGHTPEIGREAAYYDWLMRELARDHAAQLIGPARMLRFKRTRVLRRDRSEGGAALKPIEGPDALFRGVLEIAESTAFQQLVARGLGRHRAFGFGCLLLAPVGALR